jgi:tetratricopeptide (TPR) repeat protein
MTDYSRIEDLRRRVHEDPASIAFAQLAEECRRVGLLEESVEVSRSGLAQHPAYLSARVTLGRALLQLGELDEAQHEFERVRQNAPQNLPALRGLAEIHSRRGAFQEAHTYYTIAFDLAPNDPDLERALAATAQADRVKEVPEDARAARVVEALEQWLDAIHASRA